MKGMTKTDLITNRQYDFSERDLLQYALGGLLYTPALNAKAANLLINTKYENLHAMAFCLEDAIADGTENEALKQLDNTFYNVRRAVDSGLIKQSCLPYLFIRVKYPEQLMKVYNLIGRYNLLKGFIFPKFDSENADEYLNELIEANNCSDSVIYGMPILESCNIADICRRPGQLAQIKSTLDDVKPHILNIRIGGNDFCNRFGIRRNIKDTIYDIKVVADIISDIVNVFSADYVISAPVWEYFRQTDDDSDEWSRGLVREIKKDILNGLIGKTAIHPTQLPVIDSVLAVSSDDYNDAVNILNWNDNLLAVSKSCSGNRMNEKKVHGNWAKKILIRASVYGISK